MDLFRTKKLDDLIAETQEEGHQLKKALGAPEAGSLPSKEKARDLIKGLLPQKK